MLAVRLFIALFLFFCFYVPVMAAHPNQAQKFNHADRNNDGAVDGKEMRMEKNWEHEQKARVNTPLENRMDADNDGKVEPQEVSAWNNRLKERLDLNGDGVVEAKEKRLFWLHAKSKVNTPAEAKYDINNDGWLEPAESREMLKDRRELIKTDGKAKVDTELEANYDTNKDGIIDAEEAKALTSDLE